MRRKVRNQKLESAQQLLKAWQVPVVSGSVEEGLTISLHDRVVDRPTLRREEHARTCSRAIADSNWAISAPGTILSMAFWRSALRPFPECQECGGRGGILSVPPTVD